MRKKITYVLLSVFLLFALCSCNNASSDGSSLGQSGTEGGTEGGTESSEQGDADEGQDDNELPRVPLH